jgi:hypothetical protein
MSTEIALSKNQNDFVLAVRRAGQIANMPNDIIKSMQMAGALNELRSTLDNPEITKILGDLQNSALGFKTDKKDTGYPAKTLIDSALQALTMGLNLHGNEWNIIAGNCYPAQAGFDRLLREHCNRSGTNRHFTFRIPKFLEKKGQAQSVFEVTAEVYWKTPDMMEKKKEVLQWHLVGMTHDQVLGKAKKRAYQWLYNELTNNSLPLSPLDEGDIIDGGDAVITDDGVKLTGDRLAELKQAILIIGDTEETYCEKAGIKNIEDATIEMADQLIQHVKENA